MPFSRRYPAPEPAVGIVGDPSDSVARASLTFRYTVDQTGQDDRAWSIPDVSLCEESESGGEQCSTVAAAPASGTTAENTAITVALSLTCERALTWAAPVEIVLGDDDARATVAWEVECEIPPFDGELIGVEIYQGVFTRAWSRETGEWTWRTPPPIPWRTVTYRGCRRDDCWLYAHDLALTVPMIEVAGRTTLVVARVEHGHPDSYGGLASRVGNADGTAFETVARAVDRAVVLHPGRAPAEHIDVRPPGIPERRPDNPRYESEFRLEVPGSVPAEPLTGQPFRPGAWRSGSTLVLTLDPGDGRFNTPRTSESDTRLEVGADLMGRCRGGEWAISDWYYHKAGLFRAAAEGWLDMPAEEATAIQVGGAQSGAVDGDVVLDLAVSL